MTARRVWGVALAVAMGVTGVGGLQVAQAAPRSGEAGAVAPAQAGGVVRSAVQGLGFSVADGRAELGQRTTKPFSTVGVSWRDPRAAAPAKVEIRTRSAATGDWTPWHTLDPEDIGLADQPGARGTTEPVWVGPSDGVQARVDGGTGALPAGLRVDLVGDAATTAAPTGTAGTTATTGASPQGTGTVRPADTPRPPGTGPASSVPQPPIVSRAGWGADESISPEDPTYMPDVRVVFVHHTDGAAYDCSQSASLVRGIYAFHVQSNGWKDIGYNFLVDKCGTVFEGRKGGVDQPVQGAHTGGWNNDTAGIAVLGTYTTDSASSAALTSVAQVAAWKLGQYGVDPASSQTIATETTQTSGTGRSFTAGNSYSFPAISAHRDGVNTECPGDALYAQLGTIRSWAAGPMAGLAVSSVGGAAYLEGGKYHTTGPATVNWTTSTPSALISGFDVIVDGNTATPAAHVAGTARSATVTLPVGTHTVAVRGVHQSGKPATSAATTVIADPAPAATTYHPVTPTRLMDTRSGTGVRQGVVGPDGTVALPVTGNAVVPATGVTAVVLNVTATGATTSSYVSVYPDGTARTSASNLNFVKGQTIPNLVVVPVVNGKVDFYNHAGDVHLVADITGYYTADTSGSTFKPLTPKRLMDTRNGTGGVPAAPVGPGAALPLQVTGGSTGVPATGVTAVVLNVTAVAPTTTSFVSVYPDGTARTSASNLNFVKGQVIPNLVVVPVVDGKVDFWNAYGSVHLVADISGYYTSDGTGAAYSNAGPRRLMDTRSGTGVPAAKVGPGGSVALQVTGRNGIPATGVTAVVLNVTAVAPSTTSFVSVYPDGTPRSSASNLNFTAGVTIPNLVVVPVVNGKVDFWNAYGTVDLIADVTGYYTG
ncbi:N-acetylmuramoyl-L-alanine amidase [Actinacidiphila epipremni]|uniref:N-acetylmuramoyl-L-alanine amidase n=1 Tax=Actinacidiphila epipremni TaxID=2053013 RepID=A0ABX0ZYS0_9ACTN|nr:N-acetylmuramoyl-L-alanine amidase [Actinacidiphila epipremni]NJP47666.1 hypothetical protein [Actinacidiphila epipremni]